MLLGVYAAIDVGFAWSRNSSAMSHFSGSPLGTDCLAITGAVWSNDTVAGSDPWAYLVSPAVP